MFTIGAPGTCCGAGRGTTTTTTSVPPTGTTTILTTGTTTTVSDVSDRFRCGHRAGACSEMLLPSVLPGQNLAGCTQVALHPARRTWKASAGCSCLEEWSFRQIQKSLAAWISRVHVARHFCISSAYSKVSIRGSRDYDHTCSRSEWSNRPIAGDSVA